MKGVKNSVCVSKADNFKMQCQILLLLGILVEEMCIFK